MRIGHLIEVNHARLIALCELDRRVPWITRERRSAGIAGARRANSYKIWAPAAAETLRVAGFRQVVLGWPVSAK